MLVWEGLAAVPSEGEGDATRSGCPGDADCLFGLIAGCGMIGGVCSRGGFAATAARRGGVSIRDGGVAGGGREGGGAEKAASGGVLSRGGGVATAPRGSLGVIVPASRPWG